MVRTALPLALALAVFAPAALTGCSHAPPPRAQMESWEHHYPQAAQALGMWVRTHPQAANRLFEWDGEHPERSREFVTWAVTHPGEGIDHFAATHLGWRRFDEMMERHRPAADAFIDWCRHYPDAASDLVAHPGGLKWAGDHLYRADWMMETGR